MSSLFPEQATSIYAQVVVERSVDRFPDGLTYRVPETLEDLAPGERVIVPLGRGDRATAGWVIELLDFDEVRRRKLTALDPSRIKWVARRDESAPRLPESLMTLARWIDRYYCTPIGMVLASMLPSAVKRNVGRVLRTFVDLASPEIDDDVRKACSRKQRAVLDALQSTPDAQRPVSIHDLSARAGAKTLGPVRKLIDKGILRKTVRSSIEADWIRAAVDTFAPEGLTDEQQAVIAEVASAIGVGFSTHLLFGITGSGKTEVYIHLIQAVIDRGEKALMLVPEIALTPQTSGRLIGRFPHARVAILHSGLTAAQRNQQWSMVHEGKADVIIGARSAVFAPIEADDLGLIIVDEEHDSSYKQDQLPRYHGRDVAIRRGQLSDCPVLLASATPSLESWHNATVRAQYRLHRLTRRVPGAALPTVRIVDFREEMRRRKDRARVHLIGPTMEHAIRTTLEDGFQTLLLLNRRGYANYIACPDQRCGWVMQCAHCDATMVLHRHRDIPAGGYLRCHHCLTEQKVVEQCPVCNRKVVNFGLGTQRVELELHEMFPALIEGETMLRVDSDTMQSASHFHDALGRFASGELRLLIGTQMIAKGLDFPGVRLVGVINADTAINLPDFRASERTFQLVSQVAGRSGRSKHPGTVVVQSFQPHALPIRLAATHDYEGFAQQELEVRTQCGLPPLTRMARIVVRHEDHVKADEIAMHLTAHMRSTAPESLRLRGPSPCPIARIAGRHRRQIELIAPTAATLQTVLTDARNHGWVKSDATTAVDVDPIALL